VRMGVEAACTFAAAVVVLAASAAPALAKSARCDIKTSDGGYAGACDFTREKGGSFSIAPVGRSDFFAHAKDDPGITEIDVEIQGAHADVSGLTSDGINSRWGPASRSAKDKACWIGEDFAICVY